MEPRNLVNVAQAKNIQDGDQLRNINSYEYLLNIKKARDLKKVNSDLEFILANLTSVENPGASAAPAAVLASESALVKYALRNNRVQVQNITKVTNYKDLNESHYQRILDYYQGAFFAALDLLDKVPDQYNDQIAFGDLYTEFLTEFETGVNLLIFEIDQCNKRIQRFANQNITHTLEDNLLVELKALLNSYSGVIDMVYRNPNQALKRSVGMLDDVLTENNKLMVSHAMEGLVTKRLNDEASSPEKRSRSPRRNKITPQSQGSKKELAKTWFGSLFAFYGIKSASFKPQLTTSMAMVRDYNYMHSEAASVQRIPTELRFGTQAQYDQGAARVSPLFLAWIATQTSESAPHLYINNLGRDRSNMEGTIEKSLTHVLEAAERPGLFVITLPADKGILDKNLSIFNVSVSVADAKRRMLAIATGNIKNKEDVDDFYISDATKNKLYGANPATPDNPRSYNKENEKVIIEQLINRSLEVMGKSSASELTASEFQAVYFHFVKYEVTNMIVEKLKPGSINFSCKDAIDRGGVSSAYYNFFKSVELGEPMSKEEFLEALYAAPTLVKGRGMNHHVRTVYNAMNQYVSNTSLLPTGPEEHWSRVWVRENDLSYVYREKLLEYATMREESKASGSALTHKKEDKVSAARTLARLLSNHEPLDKSEFTSAEWKALFNSKLGKIVSEMKQDGIGFPLPVSNKVSSQTDLLAPAAEAAKPQDSQRSTRFGFRRR